MTNAANSENATVLQVAETIIAQLGGTGRLAAMTGARNFMYDSSSLQFSLGRGASRGISRVRVVLDPSDTYTVVFATRMGRVVSTTSDVYADSLRQVFEAETGFYLTV